MVMVMQQQAPSCCAAHVTASCTSLHVLTLHFAMPLFSSWCLCGEGCRSSIAAADAADAAAAAAAAPPFDTLIIAVFTLSQAALSHPQWLRVSQYDTANKTIQGQSAGISTCMYPPVCLIESASSVDISLLLPPAACDTGLPLLTTCTAVRIHTAMR
jgi:hypothetical protein